MTIVISQTSDSKYFYQQITLYHFSAMKTKLIIAAIVIAAFSFSNIYAQDGGQIFRTNCGACHTVGKGKLVGPDLKGVQDRHSEEWILKWVKGSQAMVKAGDKDAVKVFNDNSMIPMPDQALADNDIKTILAFIKTGGEPVTASVPAGDASKPSAVQSTGTDNVSAATQKVAEDEKAGSSFIATLGFTNYLVLFLIGILLIVIWVLSLAVKTLTEELKIKVKN